MTDAFTRHLQLLPDPEAMRHADAAAVETLGLTGTMLMETAGRGAARVMLEQIAGLRGSRVTVFCGKGNNGGDGFVVARVLAGRGVDVQVFTMDGALSSDAAQHARILRNALPYLDGRLRIDAFDSLTQVAATRPADVIVDALLGTGLTSAPRAPYDALIAWMNHQDALRVALDVPSGLDARTGAVPGEAIHAHLTATMAARKPGLVLGQGKKHAGHVAVIDIGTPRALLVETLDAHGGAYRSTDAWVRTHLPRRAAHAHKYSAGLVLALAGSPGLTGAPVMTCHAAARAGAGYVMCACPESIQPALAAHFTEVATLALPHGTIGLDPEGALEVLSEKLPKAGALLVGPGLGTGKGTQATVRRLLKTFDGPAVVDADGLGALTPDFLAEHARGRWVLTPHEGEFARLAGDVSLDDRVAVVRQHAMAWKSVLVLKGMPSLVGLPDGRVIVGGRAETALATAGTGDVLAGLVAGFLAQGLSPATAALCGLHVGSRAARRWSRRRHPNTMQATDLLSLIPATLASLA